VSAAAKRFVYILEKLQVDPNEWRDRHSRPLLYIAAQWNYVELVKWLVHKGMSLLHEDIGVDLLMLCRNNDYHVLYDAIVEIMSATAAENEDDDVEEQRFR
jgi:hypothetical protein